NETVLIDGIPDVDDVHNYSIVVDLPDLTYENCTLQIVQVMTDKPPYGDGNDLYYHCIDLRLVADGEPLPQPNEGCSCRAQDETPLGYGALAVLLLAGLRRRR
ncbi:MAG: MYXO-CTERM sorting domain-containing protein, partial [Nannocystaceae bacterium]